MNIRQAVLGAGVAALLVWGGDVDRERAQAATALQASSSPAVCDIAGMKEAVRNAALQIGNVVLDVALDVAGELKAHAWQIF
jgi:hypothetical protein